MPYDNISNQLFLEIIHQNLGNQEPLKCDINEALNNSNYHQAALALMQERDYIKGITWHKIKRDDGLDILIRDARTQEENKQKGSTKFYGYSILIIQYIRAVLDLLEIEKLDSNENKEIFSKRLILYLNALRNANKKNLIATFKAINADIVSNLQKVYKDNNIRLNAQKIQYRLGIAKDMVNLANPSFHMASLSKIDDETTVIEGEIARCQLTDKQKQRYTNIQNEKWFTALPEWQQKLVGKYADNILEENRVIPSKLLFLPGLRNAYHKITQVIDNNKIESPLEIFHSGTLLTFAKDPATETKLTEENAEQLRNNATHNNPEGKIHFISLNAVSNPHDYMLVEQSKHAINRLGKGNIHSNACLNHCRRFESKIDDGFQEQLKTIAEFMRMNNEIKKPMDRYFLANYLQYGHWFPIGRAATMKRCGNIINALPQEQKLLLETALQCRKVMDNFHFMRRDSENHNLQIAAYSHLLSQQMRDINIATSMNASACRSGKNRNGLLIFASTVYYIWQQCREPINATLTEKKKSILNIINRAGHTQFMANLSTFGCYGIKPDSRAGIPRSWGAKTQKKLSPRVASYAEEPQLPRSHTIAVVTFFSLLSIALLAMGACALVNYFTGTGWLPLALSLDSPTALSFAAECLTTAAGAVFLTFSIGRFAYLNPTIQRKVDSVKVKKVWKEETEELETVFPSPFSKEHAKGDGIPICSLDLRNQHKF